MSDLPTPTEAMLREELALAQAENVRLSARLGSTLSSLEVAHATEAGNALLQMYAVRQELHEVRGQLATAEALLLKYESADTHRPPPNTDPDD